ncbi:Fructose-specific phosphotransferase enzyme IIB component [Sodalis glossinidius str. 'morsitans']|uniref:Fructose-specific phosphotransferase enzyme IIB component n=1 Tax=Sodalis glossinidius (strain morsitans) TaxID=343509 RepID=Q2NQ74_SODGM|nr:PTS sugar transporter subunit IIB [Sodalis glossinidius]BAE75701.1 putative PTS system IIB component [Sodalis glossinidius str. 'morsitans']CRL46797.1 Fructose-specific phosphotransferase enzyme IIB component [Sodalis glossinidius str. 'morsitans']
MNNIKLVRVDFLLIHGKVITKWRNIISATEIVIVDDKLSKDSFLAEIYVMAPPLGVDVHVMAEEDFIKASQEGYFDTNKINILVLFKSIGNIKHLMAKDIVFNAVQVGELGGGVNRRSVVNDISIDDQDLQDLKFIQSQGTAVYFQVTP